MSSTPEMSGREPVDDAPLVDEGDLEISAEEEDAVRGGTVSSSLKDGRPIGS
jgi:hypothetical protein